MKNYLKFFGINIIPALLIFFSKNDSLFTWCKTHNVTLGWDQSAIQFWLFLVGIIWTGCILPLQYANVKNKLDHKNEAFQELLKHQRDAYLKLMKNEIREYNTTFSTRAFVPFWRLKYWARGEKYYKLKFIPGLSDEFGNKELVFRVHPNPEGLVGRTYNEKAIIVEQDAVHNAYNLNQIQKQKVGNVRFCTAIPIFNNNEKIIAIIGLDSESDVKLNQEDLEVFQKHIRYYGAFIDKHITF
ncbi:MAG: GAF domain-containing protein [Saprospiraceae bacterium]